MYDPLALDRQRIELERLRSRSESAVRRNPTGERSETSTAHRHLRGLRRPYRRPAAAC